MSGWQMFPHLIVRTTGFPWEMLERLRCLETLDAARRCLRAEQALQKLRVDAPRLKHPPRAVVAALKAGRAVPLEQVEDASLFMEWNRAAVELKGAQEAFERAFDSESASAKAALRELATDARLLEAVASSSPPVFEDLSRGRWSARMERQLAGYLQRLCSKNETMSFFGPINYGRIEPDAPTGIDLSWSGPLLLTGRRTHLASWLIQGVAHRIAFDPGVAPWLVLRLKGFAEPPLPPRRQRLGELLVDKAVLTPWQLERALAIQAKQPSKQRLGELLVESGHCGGADVDAALAAQTRIDQTLARQGRSGDSEETSLLHRLMRTVDGTRNLTALAKALGLPLEQLLPVARSAFEKKLVTHPLELPSASAQPLVELIERLSGIPGPAARAHLAPLGELRRRMERYGALDAAAKVRLNEETREFVQTVWQVRSPLEKPERPIAEAPEEGGVPLEQRKTQAHFYVDRLALREECRGDLRLVLRGERATELVQRLVRPLDLLGRAAESTRQRARERVAALMGKRRLPFWKVVAAFSQEAIPFDDSVSQSIAKAIPDAKASRHELGATALPAAQPTLELPLICSVDLLIAARDVEAWGRGEYELIMGDIHDTALVWGWSLQFHENRLRVEEEMLQALGALSKPMPMITALASRRTGLLPSEFPGPVIEVGGVSARPSAWRLPFDDLEVESDGKTARLLSRALQSEVSFYNGELESLVHTAFALPRIRPPRVDLGAHTPRILVEGVVLQREQWTLPTAHAQALLSCKDDKARLRAALQLWDELGLPAYVFAKLPGERKPILVDPSSPLLLRTFVNLLEHRGGEAVLSEMLPGPSQLWLGGDAGHHTAELRCVFLRGGQDA